MDTSVSMMKVIRLQVPHYGPSCYVTAKEDKVSVGFTYLNSSRWRVENAEWRLNWLERPSYSSGLTIGVARLWSIYGKVLTFFSNYTHPDCPFLIQKDLDQARPGPDSEWKLRVSQKHGTLFVDVVKWLDASQGFWALDSRLSREVAPELILSPFYLSLKIFCRNPNSWKLEVVTSSHSDNSYSDDDDNKVVGSFSNCNVGQVMMLGHMTHSPSASVEYNIYNSGGNVNAGSGGKLKTGGVVVSNDRHRL